MGSWKPRAFERHQPYKAAQSEVPADGVPSVHTLMNLHQMKGKQNGITTYTNINKYLRDTKGYWHLWIVLS